MGLRYYLRGLGIGMFVTAIVLSATKPTAKAEMTDSEVIARAKVLGMVEKETLADVAKKTDDKKDETAEAPVEEKIKKEAEEQAEAKAETKPEETAKKTDTKTDDKQDQKTDTKADQKQETKPEQKTETKPEQKPETKPETKTEQKPAETKPATTVTGNTSTIVIAVYPGEGSYTVSKKLATQGLVESADKFDNFLCQNGYDKKICTGNYEIKVGAGAEEIARALTRGV